MTTTSWILLFGAAGLFLAGAGVLFWGLAAYARAQLEAHVYAHENLRE